MDIIKEWAPLFIAVAGWLYQAGRLGSRITHLEKTDEKSEQTTASFGKRIGMLEQRTAGLETLTKTIVEGQREMASKVDEIHRFLLERGR